jgi:2-dehydro-3-deoxy-D-arabinonate dehydratase
MAVGMRGDAERTIAEAGLAAILGPAGGVVAYTGCLDLSAGDLLALGPAYRSQASGYRASCALGPALVTADELGGPRTLQVSFRLRRGGADQPEGRSRAAVPGDFDELAAWLGRDNILAGGTVVAVAVARFDGDGTGLEAGDRLELEIEGIGQLANPVRRLGGDV